jgi:hypothetical protein
MLHTIETYQGGEVREYTRGGKRISLFAVRKDQPGRPIQFEAGAILDCREALGNFGHEVERCSAGSIWKHPQSTRYTCFSPTGEQTRVATLSEARSLFGIDTSPKKTYR